MSSWLRLMDEAERARRRRRELADVDEAPLPAPIPPTERPPAFFSGLDLGQSQDFTALAIVERTTHPDPDRDGQTCFHFAVRHLHRWPLGTSYPQIVSDVKAMFAEPPLKGSVLAVDATGVGRPVVDMFRLAGISASLRPMTITGGEAGSGESVPKKNLVGSVQVPLQSRRLKIASSLPLADVLAKELEMFRVSVTASRNESFGAWRERDHDDLVLALALALHIASFGSGCISLNGQRV